MAYGSTRSMSAELSEGMTDGKYKKVVNNRGGVVEGTTQKERHDLKDTYYGIHEVQIKDRPDAVTVTTPNFAHTPDPEPTV